MTNLKKTIVLIGLMGCGKSRIGLDLARLSGMPFIDVDREIEKSAGLTVAEIFDRLGEDAFRSGEKKVMQRLLSERPAILASGGGAFMNEETRSLIKNYAVSVWLKAGIDTLVERTSRNQRRPLLRDGDKKETLLALMDVRYPVYATADITVDTDGLSPLAAAKKIRQLISEHGAQA